MNLSFFFFFSGGFVIHQEVQVYTGDLSCKTTIKKGPNFPLFLLFPAYGSLKKPLNSFSRYNSHAQVKKGLNMAMKSPRFSVISPKS